MPAAVRRPVLSQNYPNYMPPMAPDGYQPITYYNNTIKQDVGVLYNPITGDVKSDGSYVSDMLASPDMAKHFGEDARKSVEQKYVADMTPALQRPDALDMAQTSKPDPNMRADALDLPQTTNPDMGVDNYSKSGDERDFTRINATNAYDVANMYNKPALEAIDPNDDRYDFVNRNQAEEPVLNYNPSEENDFINPNGSNAYDVASMYGGKPNEFPKDQAIFTGQEMPTGARLDPYMDIPQSDVPEGFHRMPDGSIMADSEMEADGVLGNSAKASSNSKGVLNTDTTSSNDRKQTAVSANARGSMMPFAKIDRNEALIRIGGAMVGGSSQGYTGAMKAATAEYGNIQDANRLAETNAFNKAEATRLAEARIQAQRDKADKNKKAMGMPSAVYKRAALTAITDIKGRLAKESGFNPFDNNTGLFGYAMSHVAGTDAHDTANAIDTIEASIGFDRLQKMRDDSPTGGALGQVSNIELALLRKSLGSLKQSSSREQFVKNLNSIETQYKKAVAAVEAQQREWYRMQGVDVPEPKNNSAEPTVVGGYSIVTKQK